MRDADRYGRVALGPPTYSFASRQRRAVCEPPHMVLVNARNYESAWQLATLVATLVCFVAAAYTLASAVW
jgi:hypothetical protein